MNNLKPEIRVDKNGRLVTRHVKTDGGCGSSASRFAPPALKDHRELHIAAIVEHLEQNASTNAVAACRAFLEGCHSSTLEVAATAANTPETQGVISDVARRRNEHFLAVVSSAADIWSPLAKDMAGDSSGQSLRSLSEMMFGVHRNLNNLPLKASGVSPEQLESDAEAFRFEFLGNALGLEKHARTYYDYYRSLAALETEKEAIAVMLPDLMDVNESLSVLDKNGNHVINPLKTKEILPLVRMAKGNPDRAPAIFEFIKERHAFDENAVNEFLRSDQSPLTRGIL